MAQGLALCTSFKIPVSEKDMEGIHILYVNVLKTIVQQCLIKSNVWY